MEKRRVNDSTRVVVLTGKSSERRTGLGKIEQ